MCFVIKKTFEQCQIKLKLISLLSSVFAYFRRTLSNEDMRSSHTSERQRLCLIQELSIQFPLLQEKMKPLKKALALHQTMMLELAGRRNSIMNYFRY